MASECKINMRISPDDKARFERAAQHYGLSLSAWLRMVAKKSAAYAETQMEGTPKNGN